MKASLVKIGNSRGIRLPKAVIEQCKFSEEVVMEIHHQDLIIRSASHPRKGWSTAFAQMGKLNDDQLLDQDEEKSSDWDNDEWQW
jgi:antitoxin MazE